MSAKEQNLNAAYWDDRWNKAQTQWDIGAAAPALLQYAAKIEDKNIAILIPGCGNAHEAKALIDLGFTNITLIDISENVTESVKATYKAFDQLKVITGNFFEHQGKYDLMLEQTFFCAINPMLRAEYAKKAYELLNNGGRIVGVLFDRSFEAAGPPFGGSVEEYKTYFGTLFEIEKMEACFNSIEPRAGSEVFINLLKK